MVTNQDVEKICNEKNLSQKVIKAIIEIGNEALDISRPYCIGGIMGIPMRLKHHPKDGKGEFMIFYPNGEWEFDPRIIKLGKHIEKIGGFELMQSVYLNVEKKFIGSMRLLEFAWNGIGIWKA